jgi:hypothetical protein
MGERKVRGRKSRRRGKSSSKGRNEEINWNERKKQSNVETLR